MKKYCVGVMYYVMPSFITPASGEIAIGNTGSIVEGAINALFGLLFDKFQGSKTPPVINDITVAPNQGNTGVANTGGTYQVTVSYNGLNGEPETTTVPFTPNTVPFTMGEIDNPRIIKQYIDETPPNIEYTGNFYTQDRINIVRGALNQVSTSALTPHQGLLAIINGILDTTKITELGKKEIVANVEKQMSFRMGIAARDEVTDKLNSAEKLARLLEIIYVPDDEPPSNIDKVKGLLTDAYATIKNFFPPTSWGGKRPKHSYNYAHFIPVKSRSKKSHYKHISGKVKSRRHRPRRDKHTTRRR